MPAAESARHFTSARAAGVLGLLALALVGSFAVAALFGEETVSVARAWSDPTSMDASILWSLRLPRAVLGGLVGAALAASGSALQSMLKNPLADPFVLGVSGGAALGATLALALGVASLGQVAPGHWLRDAASFSAPSAFAFLGSLLATALVFGASRGGGSGSPYAALLAGVIFNAFAAAAITAVKTLAAPEKVGEILYWLAGTLGYERGGTLVAEGILQGVALGGMCLLSGRLNLLTLGDEDAASLGVPVERTRRQLLFLASLSVAGAVALSGLVGFVGLLVPHILKLWLGPDQRLLIPASALGGAAFLTLADLGARLAFGFFHAVLPVGVVTALLGGPVFLFLLHRSGLEPVRYG